MAIFKDNEGKKCPVCGDSILGRSDKIYCSDQCRFLANSKKKQTSEWPILQLNKALRKNRTILKTLCPVGKNVVRKEVMDALGYDFNVFSSIFVTSKKQIYYLCHDFGYTPILEKGIEKAMIITRQGYMHQWNPWKYVFRETNSLGSNKTNMN